MKNKSKPDDRKDNVDKIQYNIDKIFQNYELAEEMIAKTSDEKTKQQLRKKNERRLESLKALRQEIKDEGKAKEEGYKKDHE